MTRIPKLEVLRAPLGVDSLIPNHQLGGRFFGAMKMAAFVHDFGFSLHQEALALSRKEAVKASKKNMKNLVPITSRKGDSNMAEMYKNYHQIAKMVSYPPCLLIKLISS